MSSWHKFVKRYAEEHGVSYHMALSQASSAFKEYKQAMSEMDADLAKMSERKVGKKSAAPPPVQKKKKQVESEEEQEIIYKKKPPTKKAPPQKPKKVPPKKKPKIVYISESDEESE